MISAAEALVFDGSDSFALSVLVLTVGDSFSATVDWLLQLNKKNEDVAVNRKKRLFIQFKSGELQKWRLDDLKEKLF
jgi:hypothetical protein